MTEFLLSIAVVLVAWQLYKTHEALDTLAKCVKHMDNKLKSTEGYLWTHVKLTDNNISSAESWLRVFDERILDIESRLE
jgi:cytochrome oxidase assembly protein ShyY1